MKVKKLIKELQKLDKEALVELSTDEEGNSFGTVGEISQAVTKDGKKVFILMPWDVSLYEDRYK